MSWVAIGSVNDIPLRGARCVQTPHGKIGVYRVAEGRVFAMQDRCPHKGGPLSQGIVHGTSVTCPLHNWVISLETGHAQGADQGSVKTIPVKVEGEQLYIALEARAAKAA